MMVWPLREELMNLGTTTQKFAYLYVQPKKISTLYLLKINLYGLTSKYIFLIKKRLPTFT
jgi:hypothetical protein